MASKFQFSRLEMALLFINSAVFGACLVLLILGRVTGPLILLTLGTFGMVLAKLGHAYTRGKRAAVSSPPSEQTERKSPEN